MGPVMVVVEPRFKAAAWVTAGLYAKKAQPEVEPFRFASHVQIPVLMINGRYDQLYQRLGSPDKQMIPLDCGHVTPIEETVRLVDEWLREKPGTQEMTR